MTARHVASAIALFISLSLLAQCSADRQGVAIAPDETGRFEYRDDFSTGRFAEDAFRENLPLECWGDGQLTSSGPHRNRTLTYRFHGTRAITGAEVRIEQMANARSLGGVNSLYLSANGLDWTLSASSAEQQGDANNWQNADLMASPDALEAVLGQTDLWVRIVMDNHSGLQTNVSNILKGLLVALSLGETPSASGDPGARLRLEWGRLRQRAGWRSVALDWADPPSQRAPHYYEDSDGWLRVAGESPLLAPDETGGFPAQRVQLSDRRSPTALAVFVNTPAGSQAIARITVASGKGSTRRMKVSWDGRSVGTQDAATYFDHDQALFFGLPKTTSAGVHELRIAPDDGGALLVRQVALAGSSDLALVPRPQLPEGGKLELLSAYYMPDPEPPAASQVVEGRTATQDAGLVFQGLQRLYASHSSFGAMRVLFRNPGRHPLRIGDRVVLNGEPIEGSYVDFATSEWDAPGVVWYRVRPRLLQPGQCGQLYIRFRRAPRDGQCTVELPVEGGETLRVHIPHRGPALAIDYVTVDRSGRRLYVYVRRLIPESPWHLTELSLDGRPVSGAQYYGQGAPGEVALAVAELPEALRPMTYHVIGVRTAQADTAAQFRVLPFSFPRSSIHVPPELCPEMHMNLAMWHRQPFDTCRRYGIETTSHEPFDPHGRVRYVIGPDEPDANDNRGAGYDKGLGYHARRLSDCGWQELVERFSPRAASWIIMDGTVRPLNWCVYGQLADVTCFDPYPINFYGADHAYVRESLCYARLCGAPKPMYACLEAFGWQGGQGVPKGARGPTPAEYRQNVVQAIGAGMKGLTSWVYVAGAGGWQVNQPVAEEIGKMNRLVEHIEGDLLLGTPVELASADAGTVLTGTAGNEQWPKDRVAVASLLCGPDTIVVTAANHVPAAKPDAPAIEPARNVCIRVQLPNYLEKVRAFEATEDGLQPIGCEVSGRKALLRLDSLESGRVFVLRRQ